VRGGGPREIGGFEVEDAMADEGGGAEACDEIDGQVIAGRDGLIPCKTQCIDQVGLDYSDDLPRLSSWVYIVGYNTCRNHNGFYTNPSLIRLQFYL
jgi:hypothetical protein